MAAVVLFAGTTEGYELEQFLIRHRVPVCLCVATEYGTASARAGTEVRIRQGRLTAEEMTALLKEEDPVLVIDATHPYAEEATKNIQAAAQNCKKEYIRVIREKRVSLFSGWDQTDSSGSGPDMVYVKNTKEAAFLIVSEKIVVLPFVTVNTVPADIAALLPELP